MNDDDDDDDDDATGQLLAVLLALFPCARS